MTQALYLNHPLGLKWTSDSNTPGYKPIFGDYETQAKISLPKDAIFEIFTYLSVNDLLSATQVSSIWQLLIGVSLFDTRTGFNILKGRHKGFPLYEQMNRLVKKHAVLPDRAGQVYLGVSVARKNMSEIEYVWTTTDFMLKEICEGNRRVYSVKKEKFPELFNKTVQPSKQVSVRFMWTAHTVVHSSSILNRK